MSVSYTDLPGLFTYANQAQTTVSDGGTDAPASGTSEQWTVASGAGFPAASVSSTPATYFAVADTAATSEIVWVTAATTASPWVWGVTRGAEGTTPVTHATGFTVQNVVSAAGLTNFKQASNAIVTSVTVTDTTSPVTVAVYQPVATDITAGSSFEAVAFGGFTKGGSRSSDYMVWQMYWGDTLLLQCGQDNGQEWGLTTYAAGSSFDVNGTIILTSTTTACANLNLFWSGSGTASTTDAGQVTTSNTAAVSISGNGPIVLTGSWSVAETYNSMTAIAPLIYRAA